MVRSEKKLFILELILLIILLFNFFIKNIISYFGYLIIILISIGFIILLIGYEKDDKIDKNTKKKLLLFVGFYTIGFIILQYGLGFFLGYVKNPYRTDLIGIINNTISIALLIVFSEYLRFIIVKKGEKKKLIIFLAMVLLFLLDLSINVEYYDLNDLSDLLEFGTIIFLPSIFKNYVLTSFTYKYGYKQNILYRLITELYIYVLPFYPDLGKYLSSVFLMIFPLILNVLVSIGFEKEKKKKYLNNNFNKGIITLIVMLTMIALVSLNSNLFRFWIAAVGSGSMEPTINIGDAIVVDKHYSKHLDELKVGDVLVFTYGQKIFTHRITNIKIQNGLYNISTKGDRQGQLEDSWIVTNDDVIGVVVARIKYVGYPTVWLGRLLEENHG